MKKGLKITLGVILLIIVVGGFIGYKFYARYFVDTAVDTNETVYIYISRGDDRVAILDKIERAGAVTDIEGLEWLMVEKNYQGDLIVAGKYELKDGMTANELVNHLRAGNGRLSVKVQFNQVRDVRQLAGKMTRSLELDSLTVLEWLTDADSIKRYGFNEHTIISMFIPNTYHVTWDITTPELMSRMASEYKNFWNEKRMAKLKETGLSQSEVTTLASIVYWETKLPKDMPTIAGVYMNRIKKGWPLQADPTLIFAHGDYSIRRVLNVHKEIDSPYNTYKNPGLPPGPIILPPTLYMDAVLNYEEHDYMFFVAKEDFSGESYFAKTLAQHEIYANRYRRALNKKKIYN